MHNIHAISLLQAWVKNVYSLCVEGVVKGVRLSPTIKNHLPSTTQLRVQLAFSTHSIDSFTPALYTANFDQLTDINYLLSTLSTVPTIKKNKKK